MRFSPHECGEAIRKSLVTSSLGFDMPLSQDSSGTIDLCPPQTRSLIFRDNPSIVVFYLDNVYIFWLSPLSQDAFEALG